MRYIIIGNGAAGATAAEKIRTLDKEGTITIFTDENYPYYYRPKLIYFLAGNLKTAEFIMHDENWFKERGLDLHLGKAVAKIDPLKKEVSTTTGETFPYDRLLLANGSTPFVPPMPGADLEAVYTLRTIDDGYKILEKAQKSKRAVIIGGGLLGLEAGHSLLELGLSITVLDRDPYLLARQLNRRGGELLQNMLQEQGYNFIAGADITYIEKTGTTLTVRLSDGQSVEGDFVLLSVGIRTNLELAKSAGLACNRGIIVNDNLETSVPHIFAAGDVCEHNGRGYGTWLPARQQGEIAGANMTGVGRQYFGTTPAHKLKVAGIDLVSLGQITEEEGVQIYVQKETPGVYRAFFHRNGLIQGAILLGDTEDQAVVQKAITSGQGLENLYPGVYNPT